MSLNSQDTSEVYNYYLQLSEPTEEDLKRVFTEEELKILCLKHKCKVDIWRWNVVDDYRTLFTLSGRYQRWSERDRLRMLAKAVNKIRPVIHKEKDIRKTRKEEWKFQLKENILSLNFWERQRLRQPQTVLSESDYIDPEVQDQFEVNTESISSAELLTASQRKELENTPVTHDPNEEIRLQTEVNPTITKEVITEAGFDEKYLSDNDSEDSIDTVLLNNKQSEKSHKELQSDEAASEINNIYGISTMSMSISTERSTQSLTSTQLQSQG